MSTATNNKRYNHLLARFSGDAAAVDAFLAVKAAKAQAKRATVTTEPALAGLQTEKENMTFKAELLALEKAGFGDRPGRNIRMLRKLGSVDAVVKKLTDRKAAKQAMAE